MVTIRERIDTVPAMAARRRGRRLKFPDPSDYPPRHPAVLCPADRVIGLYNQANTPHAKRISKKVKRWFHAEAHNRGWGGVHFLPEVQSMHGAGCVLWPAPASVTTISIESTTLALADAVDDDETEPPAEE
jgi:hypothetical protein